MSGRTGSSSADEENSDLVGILEKLRPFQREAFEFATKGTACSRQYVDSQNSKPLQKIDKDLLGKGRILLADEMGLGKTVTSLAIMTRYMNEWPLLIVCPSSLRHTWPAEIEKFLPTLPASSIYVVSGFDDADFYANERKRNRIKIVVATYSLLQNRSAAARVLQQFDFQCVIADESHNLKEHRSQRCQLAMPLLQKAKRLVLLSGTPALARPVDLWPQVYCIAPELFGSYAQYTKSYCNAKRGRFGWDVSGLSNGDELHSKLCQIMVRRLKCDVLSELPPKTRSIIPIKLDSRKVAECRDLMKELKETRVSVSDLVGVEANQAHFEHRRLLMQAYQASGVGKANSVADFLLDWLAGSGTQKILVFAHHHDVMNTLEQAVAKKFKGVGHIRIDGTVPSSDRAARVRKFQTNSRVRVAILSITAAGVGLTLTAANSALFAELHWTPGVLAQAEDRCHRIGQQNSVNIMYCVCKDESLSVDMRLWSMLGRKVGTLGRVIDGSSSASMNASESSSSVAGAGRSTRGQSVEDELSRFFAETSTTDKTKPSASAPAKGSIMNFFKPPSAKKAAAEPVALTTSGSTAAGRPTSIYTDRGQTRLIANSDKNDSANTFEWTCDTCTFINTSPRKSPNTWFSCGACGAIHTEIDSPEESIIQTVAAPVDEVIELRQDSKRPRKLKLDALEAEFIDVDEPDSLDSVTPRPCKKGRHGSYEIIEIDCECNISTGRPFNSSRSSIPRGVVTPAEPHKPEANSPTRNVLEFTVSKNSGRISLHAAKSGNPLHVNFDIEQVISRETADSLLDAELKRKAPIARASVPVSPSNIDFSIEGLKVVVRAIALSGRKQMSRKKEDVCSSEIRSFVSSYLSLREVEKKALKDWSQPVSSMALSQTVARIMISSVSAPSTDRYAGGAKERALENVKAGTASASDHSVLSGTACAWCAGALPDVSLAKGVNSTYCSQECAENGRLGRGGVYASTRVRALVFGLERGVCQNCGLDAHSFFHRIAALQPPERLSTLCDANFKLPKSMAALERLLKDPKEGDFWQADHRIAVAEGGGGCGLENLQTLCTPCHRVETDKLRARLRLSGGVEDGSSSRKQMDIRSAFFLQKTANKKKAPKL